jgi:hypothetical protein
VLNQTADLMLAEHSRILKDLKPDLKDVIILSDIKMGDAKEELCNMVRALCPSDSVCRVVRFLCRLTDHVNSWN